MNPLTLTLLVGCSGSGKSTYAATLLNPDTLIICPDSIRGELSGDENDQSWNGLIFSRIIPIRIHGAWIQRKHVVLDATNYCRKNRKGIIERAKECGYRVEAHVLRVPIEVCKARNAGRSRVVPESVIDNQFTRWQEPSLDEGIDEVREVKL
jgi:predicted kinase